MICYRSTSVISAERSFLLARPDATARLLAMSAIDTATGVYRPHAAVAKNRHCAKSVNVATMPLSWNAWDN